MASVAVRIVAPAAPLCLRLAAAACSVLPDADVLLGLPYEHPFGHRGFSHSLCFAAVAASVALPCVRGERQLRAWLLLLVAGASHGVLDAMTDGGLGIAFLAPFDNTRSFLAWRPLVCPPIGITPFFSEWGLRVLRSEILWIWAPLLGLLLAVRAIRGGAVRAR